MTLLDEYRQGIDAVDAQLVELFLQRMELTGKVGAYKKVHGIPVLDAQRERDLLAKRAELVSDPCRKADVAQFFQSLMAISRRDQRKLVREGVEDPG